MAAKLKLSPDVSYMLGVYSAGQRRQPIELTTNDSDMLERFIRIAVNELGVGANKIILKDGGAAFYNSRLKRLFDKALERRTKTFKYVNDYSGSYLAGLFDCIGGFDRKGMFIRNLEAHDALLMENLGMHLKHQGSKAYIMNENAFAGLISKHSSTLGKVKRHAGRKP
ncbi:MAG: hypothetical protein M1160_04435 [Candidatus Marsarchaeota archaeon]|jgi:hypothetical protein|nr:hypothetical protein [Candidatus Marsarchaeota archaeon]MCL5112086.1 hypothetical protein [Candidatus Marsarchaeota archaeon]